LYNSVADCGSKENFYSRLDDNADCLDCSFNIEDIFNAVHSQKKGKAADPDGLAMEAYIYGSRRLFIHLSILFNMFITHCYLPDAFMQSTILPLVKCKGGDNTDINNYRAIALSKILETLFFSKVSSTDLCDKYQFGFKATGLCTNAMKSVVD